MNTGDWQQLRSIVRQELKAVLQEDKWISEIESEKALSDLAVKMKLDWTEPQDFALGWRQCFDWIKSLPKPPITNKPKKRNP